MPRTKVMLIGGLGAGFPGAGGPIPRTVRAPYPQPNFRLNRHMPIPSTWGEPQNLLQVTDKTNYNPYARASGGAPITPALAGVNVKKLISPVLFGLGAGETTPVINEAVITQLQSNTVPVAAYNDVVNQAESWKYSFYGATAGVVVLGATMAAIHGYRRNKGKTGYAVLWGLAGGVFPILTNGIALAQGYAKPSGG